MQKRFHCHGKLLLTGEYVVLDGAKALALPTKAGQDLNIRLGTEPGIRWRSYDHDGQVWIDTTIDYQEIDRGYDEKPADERSRLIKILHEASSMNSGFFNSDNHLEVETYLTFPREWGLGTSSTLICNIARWLEIDPYALQEKTFGGSGYDIACALHDKPVVYRLEYRNPTVNETDFRPPFSEHLYFVYLNKKQDSRVAIEAYRRNKPSDLAWHITELDEITETILNAGSLDIFEEAIREHEQIISKILKMEPVKNKLFGTFHGTVKSLGGWGGDFALAISKEDPTDYFIGRGFRTVIKYNDMIK